MIIRDYPKRNSILILELIFYTELKKLARLGLPFYGLYYIRPTIFRTYPDAISFALRPIGLTYICTKVS